jgi:nitric oxide reductase NorF protein
MENSKGRWLFGCTIWLILIALVTALIAAQWTAAALPLAAFAAILVLTLIKARIVILDFMGLRGVRPGLAAALAAWPALFLLVAAAKAAVQTFAPFGF